MRYLIFLIVFSTAFLFSYDALGKPNSATSSKPSVPETVTQPTLSNADANNDKQQIKLLEAELNLTRQHQASILATVHWALGGIFVVVGLLLGFGWFANFKVYERDKEALKVELQAIIIAKTSELDSLIITKASELSNSISSQISEAVDKSEASTTNKLNKLSDQLFEMDIQELRNKMENTESHSVALSHALRALRLCASRKVDAVPDILNFMLKRIDKGGKLTAHEITRVNMILAELPSHYETLTEKLRIKLVASDIF